MIVFHSTDFSRWLTVSILHASQLDIQIAYIYTYIHANSHHLLAQVGAILEERVAHQGCVDGKPDLGVESLDHGLDWNGKVMEESVPLRQKMRSYGSLEISRIENEASGHGVCDGSAAVCGITGIPNSEAQNSFRQGEIRS